MIAGRLLCDSPFVSIYIVWNFVFVLLSMFQMANLGIEAIFFDWIRPTTQIVY